jgi:hypothetical protein
VHEKYSEDSIHIPGIRVLLLAASVHTKHLSPVAKKLVPITVIVLCLPRATASGMTRSAVCILYVLKEMFDAVKSTPFKEIHREYFPTGSGGLTHLIYFPDLADMPSCTASESGLSS